MPKRVKPWWFTAENGKLALHVRYGSRALELAKGKFVIEVALDKDLAATLDLIKAAVLAGELNAAIDATSSKVRAGFAKYCSTVENSFCSVEYDRTTLRTSL